SDRAGDAECLWVWDCGCRKTVLWASRGPVAPQRRAIWANRERSTEGIVNADSAETSDERQPVQVVWSESTVPNSFDDLSDAGVRGPLAPFAPRMRATLPAAARRSAQVPGAKDPCLKTLALSFALASIVEDAAGAARSRGVRPTADQRPPRRLGFARAL